MSRDQQIINWLTTLGIDEPSPRPASSDASFRRYLRIDDGNHTRVVMDAPPAHEDCRPFIAVTELLSAWRVHAPAILSADVDKGFLLLEDLGTQTYYDQILSEPERTERLYGDAIDALAKMQIAAAIDDRVSKLPPYDEALLRQEMELFPVWLLDKHLERPLSPDQRSVFDEVVDRLVESALEQPRTFVHRDYHCRNLMVLPKGNPGVIDYQDAMLGPVTYDLVSLLRDCYLDWSDERQQRWINRYRECLIAAGLEVADRERFARWMDLMGMQRHLKASGIFARLYHRDGKPGYLADIPRTVRYLRDVCQRREEFADLLPIIDSVLDALQRRADAEPAPVADTVTFVGSVDA